MWGESRRSGVFDFFFLLLQRHQEEPMSLIELFLGSTNTDFINFKNFTCYLTENCRLKKFKICSLPVRNLQNFNCKRKGSVKDYRRDLWGAGDMKRSLTAVTGRCPWCQAELAHICVLWRSSSHMGALLWSPIAGSARWICSIQNQVGCSCAGDCDADTLM